MNISSILKRHGQLISELQKGLDELESELSEVREKRRQVSAAPLPEGFAAARLDAEVDALAARGRERIKDAARPATVWTEPDDTQSLHQLPDGTERNVLRHLPSGGLDAELLAAVVPDALKEALRAALATHYEDTAGGLEPDKRQAELAKLDKKIAELEAQHRMLIDELRKIGG